MRKILLALILLTASALALRAQVIPEPKTDDAAATAAATAELKNSLLLDLRGLETEAEKLDKPLAEAAAKAEIADVAWTLDREWSKKLLREALELTFPEKVDRARLRNAPVGSQPNIPTPEDMARSNVRRRVMDIAGRDKAFAVELAEQSARELGKGDEVMQFSTLASMAAKEGRMEDAGGYILRALDADPTAVAIAFSINEVAARDRAAADKLIIRYIERLRALPVSVFIQNPNSLWRTTFALLQVLNPNLFPGLRGRGEVATLPAGRDAFRAYFVFVLDTYTALEQAQPGSTNGSVRFALTGLWQNLNSDAPELIASFLELEKTTRAPGAEAFTPPTGTLEEGNRKSYEDRLKMARKTKDQLDIEVAVGYAKSRKDFTEARKLLDLMKDGDLKTKLGEALNTDEAVYLAEQGDVVGAERLARQLSATTSLLRAYPLIIKLMVKNKDASSATVLANEAVRKLKQAEANGAANDAYVPSLLAPVANLITGKQSKLLQAQSDLALAVAPANVSLALDILDGLVESANKIELYTENGNPGFNADVFTLLASKDEGRARATASGFKDRLQRIAALAAVYRSRVKALDAQDEKPRDMSSQK